MAKESRISVKVEESLKAELEGATARLGVNEASVVRACVAAFLDYVKHNDEITLPFTLVPRRKLAEMEKIIASRPEQQGAMGES